jgi:hypothetical protein
MTCSFRLGRAQIFQLNGRSNWPILWALGMLTLEMPNEAGEFYDRDFAVISNGAKVLDSR